MDVIRALHRAHHGHRTVTRDRDHALRLDIELLLKGYAVFSFDNSVSGCESLINVSAANQEPFENIVCAVNQFVASDRLSDIQDGCSHVVFDMYIPRGSFDLLFACAGYQQDRLIVMTNLRFNE